MAKLIVAQFFNWQPISNTDIKWMPGAYTSLTFTRHATAAVRPKGLCNHDQFLADIL